MLEQELEYFDVRVDLITSQKGGQLALCEGYKYRMDRVNKDRTKQWRCTTKKCTGRMKQLANGTVINIIPHTHAPDNSTNEAEKIMSQIREEAARNIEKPRHLIQRVTEGADLEALSQLPRFAALQQTVQRQQRKAQHPYSSPTTLGDIAIPNQLQLTTRDQPFLLWDSGVNDPRGVFMFGTVKNLSLLSTHTRWAVDGTFKVAPDIFQLLFTIHAIVDNSAIPMIYVLLTSKLEADYERIFTKLLELKASLAPTSILCDFEKAVQNAAHSTFPSAEIEGCFFHLGQCLWRKIQDLRLVQLFGEDSAARLMMKSLSALAFLPCRDVADAFDELSENCMPVLSELYDYWEDTFIGRRRRNRRIDGRFPLECWNVHLRTRNCFPRTNNSIEGWHRSFQQTINCHHPSVCKLIEYLRREQDWTEQRLDRNRLGEEQPVASKTKYVQLNQRLLAIVNRHETITRMEFLSAIAQQLRI